MSIGIVVIGRNEGVRLRRCLAVFAPLRLPFVYVDSGSVDDSVSVARALGGDVLELDLSTPFTAARARNAGFRRLLATHPDLSYVQFVDGDCEFDSGWIEVAARFLKEHPDFAAVCGRLTERHPDATIYNKLIDIEWARPPGVTEAFAGNVAMRVDAFQEAGGFNDQVIAAEDDEFAVRLRAADWKLMRLAVPMAVHDAEMKRFSQWWRRSVRAGHAFAEVNRIHPTHFRGQPRKIILWSVVIPLVAFAAYAFAGPLAAMAVLMLYPASLVKCTVNSLKAGRDLATSLAYAFFLVIGKFPQFIGLLKYHKRRLFSDERFIIEYK
jgi:GT2 family glycosyltransferase